MNVSIAPPSSQVYVEISSLSAQISSSNNVEDVHICGSCKRSFSDLDLFVEHKRAGCPVSTQKTSTVVAPPYTESSLSYVTTNTSNANEDGMTQLGTQYLRVILDDEHLNIQENQSQNQDVPNSIHCPANTDHQILRARLLGVEEQENSEGNHGNFQNSNDLHSLVLEEQQQRIIKREFQIDEEDVATLLANQLASEVVNSVHETSISSKAGLISITHDLVQKSGKHFDLESINIPNGANENIVVKVNSDKSCSVKESGASKNSNSTSVISTNLRWTGGNKGLSNKINAPVTNNSPENEITNPNTCDSSLESSHVVSSDSNVVVPITTGKKKHKCSQSSCDFTTWYQKDLIRHERKHTGERPFQCFSCNRNFSRLDKLHMHERIHTGDKRHRCDICDYATHDSGSLRKHLRIHNDERPYKCQMCPYRSRDSSQLTVHLRTHTGDNPFVCTFENCTSAFKTSSDLKRHSRTHTGEKPFSCAICPYKCAIKSNLRVHIRLTHSETKSISCHSCSYVASTKKEVKEHEKTHTASSKTNKKKKLGEIFRKKHKTSAKEIANDTLRNQSTGRSANARGSAHLKPFCVKAHKCTYCDAAFVREDSWRSHMRQHQNALGNTSSITASSASSITEVMTKDSSTEDIVTPDQTEESVSMATDSGVENSLVQYSAGEKSDKDASPVVEQLTQEVLDSENIQSQPIFLYVQNTPVLHSGFDNNLRNAEIVTSINQTAPILVAGSCSQFLPVPLQQGGSFVEHFTSPLPQSMQYIVSAPFEGFVGSNTTYIQPLQTTDSSGNAVSVVSFQVDKGSVVTSQERNT